MSPATRTWVTLTFLAPFDLLNKFWVHHQGTFLYDTKEIPVWIWKEMGDQMVTVCLGFGDRDTNWDVTTPSTPCVTFVPKPVCCSVKWA